MDAEAIVLIVYRKGGSVTTLPSQGTLENKANDRKKGQGMGPDSNSDL